MIIKNFRELATTKARKDALEIVNAGIESVLVEKTIEREMHVSRNSVEIQGKKWKLSRDSRIFVVGAGKAAADMARAVEKKLAGRISEGIVIDTRSVKLKKVRVVHGTHPLPSQKNLDATQKIISILEGARGGDIIFNLISGGGSALMEYPRVSLPKLIQVNKLLLKGGAGIEEINAVRKHISRIKGGQLSALAGKAKVITLIVSDVITNDLNVIASGPSVPDPTTVKDAERIRKRYRLPALPFVETPKNKLPNTTNILLITNKVAVAAMEKKAKRLGYKTRILTTELKGEARDEGERLSKMAKPKIALIAAGETTVTVKGSGKGGRNQELALSASGFIKRGVLVSSSTDGVDFITEAGGGIVDENTREKAENLGLNAGEFLKNNDSYNFLRRVNGIIRMGKTGTNVCDLIVVLGE